MTVAFIKDMYFQGEFRTKWPKIICERWRFYENNLFNLI